MSHSGTLQRDDEPVEASFADSGRGCRHRLSNGRVDWDRVVPIALQLMANGKGHAKAARMLRVNASSLYARLNSDRHREAFVRAQKERAWNTVELAIDTVQRTDLDPNDKKVRADLYKWIAARMNNGIFGDRLAPPTADDGQGLSLDQLASEIAALEAQTGLTQRLQLTRTTLTLETSAAAPQAAPGRVIEHQPDDSDPL